MAIKVDILELAAKVGRIEHNLSPRQYSQLVGLRLLRWVDQNFRAEGSEEKWAPLRPSTIAGRRGQGVGARALQDTGRLKQSFAMELPADDKVVVGTSVEYAKWHHEGTRAYKIIPKRARVLKFNAVGGTIYSKKVNHPGLPSRKLIPSERLAREISVDAIERAMRELIKKEGAA
jgi:phage gpG-like protein